MQSCSNALRYMQSALYFDAEPQNSGSFCRSDDDKVSDSGTEVGSDFSGGMFPESGDEEEYFSEETRSRFTKYSMTSSVIRRNDQLRHLDDRFEKVREHSLIKLSGLALNFDLCEDRASISVVHKAWVTTQTRVTKGQKFVAPSRSKPG